MSETMRSEVRGPRSEKNTRNPNASGTTNEALEEKTVLSRRSWLGVASGIVAVSIFGDRAWALGPSSVYPTVDVYRSPSCGCCGKWITLMKKAGFTMAEHSMDDVSPVKRKQGVPESLDSCHTALAGGYVFEGHVPPDLVSKVLHDRPAILGLSAPGMPQSAPGMDIGHTPYEVISFTKNGRTAVYAKRS